MIVITTLYKVVVKYLTNSRDKNLKTTRVKMKKCLQCKNEFDKGKIVGGRLGFAWIVFIFFSMGLGLIFWLFFRGKRKEVCPYCKSENIIDKKYYKEEIHEIKEESTNDKRILKPLEKNLINEYFEKDNYFDKECKDTIIKHYLEEINLLSNNNLLTIEEKKELGLNTRLKISHDLINIFDLEKLDNKNPKDLLNNFLYSIRNKVSSAIELNETSFSNIKFVKLSSCMDERDCSWCKENDGKLFLTHEAFEIMNENCKCDYFRGVFIAHFEELK